MAWIFSLKGRITIISFTQNITLVFLVKRDLDGPLVLETKTREGKAVTRDHLRLCAQRLVIDFNGLSYDWK